MCEYSVVTNAAAAVADDAAAAVADLEHQIWINRHHVGSR